MTMNIRDIGRCCPDCGERGGLSYAAISDSFRSHRDIAGVECQDYFGPSRDYACSNCDCEFTLTSWEPL